MLTRFTGSEERKAGYISSLRTGRAARPEEIAQTILFVASDRVPYLMGQSIAVDGAKLAG
jgi:NAD(P)-dependent dehydrogenase (short-subunit alcohol dehydrogenase family)